MINRITWSDTEDIVESLLEKYKEVSEENFVMNLNFVELKKMIKSIDNFSEDNSCNEKKLEAVQQMLLNECNE